MKNFTKALDNANPAFQNICTLFTKLNEAKVKEGRFMGPQKYWTTQNSRAF